MNPPLVSYIMPCFNEELYLERAIGCAFEQTYERMEIILSDNCSSDRTHQIMQDMAASYSGPHDVRVIQQPDHCNVCEHTNRMMTEVRGGLAIHAPGDDLHEPHRVETIVRVWRETGASVIANNLIKVNEDATQALEVHRDPNGSYDVTLTEILDRGSHNACTGAMQAWEPRLLELYGPLPDWYHTSDLLIPFWGALEGGCVFISEPLTYYRVSGKNTGLGSLHMVADEDGKRELEERMHADVLAQQVRMRRTLSRLQEQDPTRLDYEECFRVLYTSMLTNCEHWADTRDATEQVASRREERRQMAERAA